MKKVLYYGIFGLIGLTACAPPKTGPVDSGDSATTDDSAPPSGSWSMTSQGYSADCGGEDYGCYSLTIVANIACTGTFRSDSWAGQIDCYSLAESGEMSAQFTLTGDAGGYLGIDMETAATGDGLLFSQQGVSGENGVAQGGMAGYISESSLLSLSGDVSVSSVTEASVLGSSIREWLGTGMYMTSTGTLYVGSGNGSGNPMLWMFENFVTGGINQSTANADASVEPCFARICISQVQVNADGVVASYNVTTENGGMSNGTLTTFSNDLAEGPYTTVSPIYSYHSATVNNYFVLGKPAASEVLLVDATGTVVLTITSTASGYFGFGLAATEHDGHQLLLVGDPGYSTSEATTGALYLFDLTDALSAGTTELSEEDAVAMWTSEWFTGCGTDVDLRVTSQGLMAATACGSIQSNRPGSGIETIQVQLN